MPGIKNDIKTQEFKNVYLIWGEEDFLRDYYKKALVDKVLDPSFADFNYKEYTSKSPDNDEISDYVSSYPCMSEKKVLYIKDSDLLKKTNETDKKFWLSLLDDMPDFVIIIFSEKNVDKRNALYKNIAKNHSVDEFAFQKPHDLINWIGRYLSKYNKEIAPATAQYLIDCCSPSMYLLKNEIEKLASFTDSRQITSKDIDICCCKVAESRVFDMLDNALDGKTSDACKKYEELKLLREEPIAINGAVFSKFSQLRKIKLMSKTMSAREIATKTNQKEFIVSLNLKKVRSISDEKLDAVINLCAETDHKIKSGKSEPWAALDVLMATIIS
ncbi:MAG: DNA polymerase III subunit delta [Clostridia bacterium]|nr:DNA polymerase III subunit delta [Clostridia bacterium]